MHKIHLVSIITPSIRPKGIELVRKALKRQTIKTFEWIVVSPFKYSFCDKWIQEPKKNKGDVWTLNKAYNATLREAKGDMIVSLQDYTFIQPDAISRFWEHFKNEPKTLVTAVGNKYENEDWLVETWRDPRMREDQGTFYQCYPSDIEWNCCSVPKKAIYDVGGFDENMDKKYGMDGYSVNDRIDILGGYDFKIDQTIKSYSLEHGRINGDEWDKNNWNGKPYLEYRKKYIGKPKLNYLK